MNQEAVKERLQKLHDSPVGYTVIFSGKKNRKVNGLYKPLAREIIIHNRNFLRQDGSQNESLLMFTAIHELAHHVLIAEMGKKSARAHTQLFWATFYDLVDKAEAEGLYSPEIDIDTQNLLDEVDEINKQIAYLQRQLGRVLSALADRCAETGLRFEDMAERNAQISKQTMKTAVNAYRMGDQGVGADIQAEAAKERDDEKRAAILAAGRDGKSVVQAKNATAAPPAQEDETATLIKEKRRIERTIESLTRRLEELNEQLISKGGENGKCDTT